MTTTFQTPLQTADYTKLRGANGNNRWPAWQFITLCKNTVVFAARANGAQTATSYATIPFDTVTVGAYTDVEIGETFFLSHTSNIRDYYYRGRIRGAATSTNLLVNETSVNITDDDYIFVVYDFDVWDVLSRMVGTTQYEDFNLAYMPLPPVAVGLQTAYVNYDPSDGAYRVPFDVSASYATDEGSSNVLTYQFTFVGGTYTVISGALNTAVVTVDFNANTEQWGKLVITDSQGTITTRRFYVRAHGSTDTPSFDFTGTQITGSLDSGWNATVSAWNGVSNLLDQTFCVISRQEYYNGTLGPVSIANNIDMVGRFHREDNSGRGDPLYSYVAEVKFDIEGIATQLQRLEMQDLTTQDVSPATAWDEIAFNTAQRSIVHYWARHCTVLSLCDLTFPDGFDLTYLFPYFPNQGGNCLDAIKGIAAQFNASVEFAPDGRIQVVRDTRFLTDKSGVVDVGDFTDKDFTTLGLGVDPVDKTGRLDAYGAAKVSGNIEAFRSRAPGNAQSYPGGQSTLDNQVLPTTTSAAAQTELNYRAGQQLAIENLTYSQDWKATTGGYHFLIPSRGQRVTHTLSAATNVRGLSFDTSDFWQIVSITINHDNTSGAREVSTHEELEPPTGDSGDTVPQIAGGTQTNPILLQPLDPFPNLPDDPGNYLPDDPTPNPYPPLVPPKTGETVIYTDGSLVDTSRSVRARRTPVWTGVTPVLPAGYTVKDVTFDRTTIKPPVGAYAVASDGTDSIILYTADAFAKPVVWMQTGTPFAGVYSQIRSAGVAGSVMVYSSDTSSVTTTLDFTTGQHGTTNSLFGQGSYVAATGWQNTCVGPLPPSSYYFNGFSISLTFMTGQNIIGFSFEFDQTLGPNTPNTPAFNASTDGVNFFTVTTIPIASGNNQVLNWSGSLPNTLVIAANANCDSVASGCGATGGSNLLKSMTYTIGSGNGGVRYSSDYGATVGSALSLGSSPGGAGGFDLELTGTASLAAASGQVKIATTLGGAYSNAAGGTLSSGQPVTLALPYRRWPHGAVQYAVSDPDYLLMSSVQISSAAVWKVNGATGVKTDITPASGAIGIGPNLATMYQTSTTCHILLVVNVSGAFNLYRSADAGATWTLSKTCANPIFLRYKRFSPAVAYLIDGSSLFLTFNHGVSWVQDTLPNSTAGVSLEAYD